MSRYLILILCCWAPPLFAAEARLSRESVDLYVSTRTAEQLGAFYAARGLPEAALQEITKACFLTVGLHNRRPETLWLEPAAWRFVDAQGKPVTRITRAEWKARWTALQVPLAAQSTFGWTQLPESRDLYPDETVAGNVTVVPPAGSFSLIARFRSGADGSGKTIELTVPGLSCAGAGAKP